MPWCGGRSEDAITYQLPREQQGIPLRADRDVAARSVCIADRAKRAIRHAATGSAVEVHTVDARGRSAEHVFDGPKRRAEGVADARLSAAGDAVRFTESEREPTGI